MKILHAIAAMIGVAWLSACAPLEMTPPADQGPVTITLSRSSCYGFCPDYTVSISGDGSVTYEGHRFVNVTGVQHGQISHVQVQALLNHFEAANFMNLRDEYRAPITDIPEYRITLTRGGRTKHVVDYGGPSAGMPEAVRDLEAEIDSAAHTDQWVLRNGEHVRQ